MPSHRSSLSLWLTAWYTVACLVLLAAATGILYWALASDLNNDTDLFLADKVNVVRSILRERPHDWSGLHEEIALEPAARRYERFYIRLLNERGDEVMSTPGMDRILARTLFPSMRAGNSLHGVPIISRDGHRFMALTAAVPVGVNTGKIWRMQVAIGRTKTRNYSNVTAIGCGRSGRQCLRFVHL